MNAQEIAKAIRSLTDVTSHDITVLKLAVQFHIDVHHANTRPRVGERVSFGKAGGMKREGIVVKVNEKSIMINVNGGMWRVSPQLVTRLNKEG